MPGDPSLGRSDEVGYLEEVLRKVDRAANPARRDGRDAGKGGMSEIAEATRSAEPIVTLTAEAAAKVREFRAGADAETVLRVSVIPGGCSGFEYGLDMDTAVREDDFTFESEGVPVVIDPFSAQYLAGLSIGYHSSFQGTGFTFENPNATGSCGCGTSFAV